MSDAVLSIDCGTQSLRAMLFDLRGRMLAKAKIDYAPYVSPKPGWAEQDAELYWRSLCEATRTLRESAPLEFARVVGVGVTAQRDSMVCLDGHGVPLRPAVLWLDQRKAAPVYRPSGVRAVAYSVAGMLPAIRKIQVEGACNWIRQNEPSVWQRTALFAQLSGFLNLRLTGEPVDSVASQIGHIPFDYRRRRWARSGQLTARLFPIEPDKLPRLVPPGARLGRISEAASRHTGIAAGTPVIACASDKGCETLGSGVVSESRAALSFGTTATVQTTSRRYFEPIRFMPPYPAPIAGWYSPEVEIFRGYWMISWFRDQCGYEEVLEGRQLGIPPEQLFDRLLKDAPPGALGLTVQPYWSPGLKTPSAKGAMIGFGDVHDRSHVYRAVIEGLSYALREGLDRIERAGRFRVTELTVSGGASQSDEICQITADVFGRPILRGRTFENAGLGAAILSAVGLGAYPSCRQAVKEMVAFEHRFEPIAAHSQLYAKLYNRVYRRMYAYLKGLYEEIRKITGYPEIA